MSLTLPVVFGKKYVRRDGKIVTAERNINPGVFSKDLLWVGDYNQPYCDFAETQIYDDSLVFPETGKVNFNNQVHPNDLVADYIDNLTYVKEAIENNKVVMYRVTVRDTTSDWYDVSTDSDSDLLRYLLTGQNSNGFEYEFKTISKRTITINGVEYEGGITVKPPEGATVYIISFYDDRIVQMKWISASVNLLLAFEHGKIFDDREKAEKVKNAMNNVFKGDV